MNWLSAATVYAAETQYSKELSAAPAAARGEAKDSLVSHSIPLFNAVIKNEETAFMLFPDSIDEIEINQQDRDGKTALHYAVLHASNLEIIDLLLARGIDINRPDNAGNTALHCVVFALINSEEPLSDPSLLTSIIRHLVQRGALTTLKNNAGKTIVDLVPRDFAHPNDVDDLSSQVFAFLSDELKKEKTLRVLFASQLISEFSGGGLTSREKLKLKSFLVQALIKKATVLSAHKKSLLRSLGADYQLAHEGEQSKRYAIVQRELNKLKSGEFLWLTVTTKGHSMDGCFQKYDTDLYYTTANSGSGLEYKFHSAGKEAEAAGMYKTSFTVKIVHTKQIITDFTEYFLAPAKTKQEVTAYYKFIEEKLGPVQIDQRRTHKEQLSDNCVTQGMLAMIDYLRDNNVFMQYQIPLLAGDNCNLTEYVLDFLVSQTSNRTIQMFREFYQLTLAIDRSFEEVENATKLHEKVSSIYSTFEEVDRLGYINQKIYNEYFKRLRALLALDGFFSKDDSTAEDMKKFDELLASLSNLNALLKNKVAACSPRPDIAEKGLDLCAKIGAFKKYIAELEQLVTKEEKNYFSAKWSIVFALEDIYMIIASIDAANLKDEERQEISGLIRSIKALVIPVYEQGNNPHEDTALNCKLHSLIASISRRRIQGRSVSSSSSTDGLLSPVSRSVDNCADDDDN
jgi:hypothetical protein